MPVIRQSTRASAISRVLVGAGVPLTAAFFLWGYGNTYRDFAQRNPTSGWPSSLAKKFGEVPSHGSLSSSCGAASFSSLSSSSLSSSISINNNNTRTRNTTPDKFFKTHGKLPLPTKMHLTLPPRINESEGHEGNIVKRKKQNILVIGDVHGCYKTLITLHQTAVQENDDADFEYVILVGDLCNKGPESARVVRFVRTQTNWFSVRGNHEDGALAAALGDVTRRQKKKYKWVMDGEIANVETNAETNSKNNSHLDDDIIKEQNNANDVVTLSDEDVMWLSELPYSITIPRSYLDDTVDTTIVHAGFIPGVELALQTIDTMITLREVIPTLDQDDEKCLGYEFHERQKEGKENSPSNEDGNDHDQPRPWASVWDGPTRVIFGHDARRGLQRFDGDWAIGLDTGAVYGKKLTGIILPERKVVSIDSQEEQPAPIGGSQK